MIFKGITISLVTFISNFNFIKSSFPIKSCSPPSNPYIKWQSSNSNSNIFYGITEKTYSFRNAVNFCDSLSSKLISITDQNVDENAQSLINSQSVKDELVLYSGRYFKAVDTWLWCPDEYCEDVFNYTNWLDNDTDEGNCMGGYSDGENYGWIKRDCETTKSLAMCVFDCENSPKEPDVLVYFEQWHPTKMYSYTPFQN